MKPNRLVVVAALLAVAACSESGQDRPSTSPPTAESGPPSSTAPPPPTDTPTGTPTTAPEQPADLTPEVVARNLEVPWGIAFLPDGSALVAERASGQIQRVVPGGDVTDVGTVPGVVATSEGGLLGLAVSPTYPEDQTIFAYYTTDSDNRVARMTFDGQHLGAPDPILTGIPSGAIHDGGRIAFGPDDMLYITTGEAGNEQLAQDPDSLGGKILRIKPNGDIPADNPDPGSPVWTLGHRNVEGITWDDAGRMWATEFGASTWDELNLIEPGNNYGWPATEGRSDVEEFTDPVLQWPTGEASPSGIAYLDGALWIGALQGERLYRVPVRKNGVGEPEALFVNDYGRLRSVESTPDGDLWFTTSNRDGRGDPVPADDRILEIRP
ncbi:MAG TPA: PQQ-dependent sugar dehydrogenase [Nocardioidaceae bacterium]|nr:PQQ-dependent sugar dehydrogenase [Nocardioidaceae bacterium]